MKIIVAGSRDIKDESFVWSVMEKAIKDKGIKEDEITIVTGGARGVDTVANKLAAAKGWKCIVMNADWDKHGKSAGYIRNREMAKVADMLIAIWDGESRGTKNMISEAKQRGLDVVVEIAK